MIELNVYREVSWDTRLVCPHVPITKPPRRPAYVRANHQRIGPPFPLWRENGFGLPQWEQRSQQTHSVHQTPLRVEDGSTDTQHRLARCGSTLISHMWKCCQEYGQQSPVINLCTPRRYSLHLQSMFAFIANGGLFWSPYGGDSVRLHLQSTVTFIADNSLFQSTCAGHVIRPHLGKTRAFIADDSFLWTGTVRLYQ